MADTDEPIISIPVPTNNNELKETQPVVDFQAPPTDGTEGIVPMTTEDGNNIPSAFDTNGMSYQENPDEVAPAECGGGHQQESQEDVGGGVKQEEDEDVLRMNDGGDNDLMMGNSDEPNDQSSSGKFVT